jgi:hypothetical protein
MIPQTETKPQLDRFDGGAKRIAQSVPGRPDGGSDWGSGYGGEGCGCLIMVIAFVLLGLLFWRMA